MAQKYIPPKETGREYVDCAKKFNAYVTSIILKLPEKWKDYILTPVHLAAEDIESLTLRANRVYINHKNMDTGALIEAYTERIGFLKEALREFTVFDNKFEHMMTHVDLMHSEVRRLKAILKSLIISENRKTEKEGKEPVSVDIKQRMDEIEYTTVLGTKRMKLGFTAKNRDYLLKLETGAREEIEKRLSKDLSMLKRMKEAETSQ